MTSPVSLEALLRRMSRDAEKIFNKCGEVPMLWLLETADGEQKMLTTPLSIPPGMSPGDYKHHLDASLRDLFAREHVVRYGQIAESWTLACPNSEQPLSQPIRDNPLRQEARHYRSRRQHQIADGNARDHPPIPLGRLLDLLASNAESPRS
jgi:hypothetical protein